MSGRGVTMRQHERDAVAFEVQRECVTCIDGGLMSNGSRVAANVFAKAGTRDKALGAVLRVAGDAHGPRHRRGTWRSAPDEAGGCRGGGSHQAQHNG